MKKFWASLVAAAAVFIVGVWLVDYTDTFESHFETYQKLKESELMSRGWVSNFIPKSSYDIHETHKVNGSLISARFRYQPGDTKALDSGCVVLSDSDSPIRQYKCKNTTGTVVVRLEGDGAGEMLNE